MKDNKVDYFSEPSIKSLDKIGGLPVRSNPTQKDFEQMIADARLVKESFIAAYVAMIPIAKAFIVALKKFEEVNRDALARLAEMNYQSEDEEE